MIYKYSPYHKDGFVKEGILLGAPQRHYLNDPFESYPCDEWIPKAESMGIALDKVKDKYGHDAFYYANTHLGVISFSKTYDKVLMWSHYANDHKGMVIGFDMNHKYFTNKGEYFTNKGYRLKKVLYRKKIPLKKIFADGKWNEKFFEYKSNKWKREKEYRILKTRSDRKYWKYPVGNKKGKAVNGKPTEDKKLHHVNDGHGYKGGHRDSDNDINLFPIPYDAMKSIHFGCRMTLKKKKKIIKKLEKREAHQLRFQGIRYGTEPEIF